MDDQHYVKENVELKKDVLHEELINEKSYELKTTGNEENVQKGNNSNINENIIVDDCLSSNKMYENNKNLYNEENGKMNHASTNNNYKNSNDSNNSNLNNEKRKDLFKNNTNNINGNLPYIDKSPNLFNKTEDEKITENKEKIIIHENNLNELKNSLIKKKDNLYENDVSSNGKKNYLSNDENNLKKNKINLNESENSLSGSDNYLSADENNITKEKLDNIGSNYKEEGEGNSNNINFEDFEESNFFNNNFFDFQKAEDSLKTNTSLIDIYNEMKNYEEDFLDYLERIYENVEEDDFIGNEEKNSVYHVNFNSIESISSFFNNSNISNLNIAQMKHYLNDNINLFVEEQKKLNKKIKINKNYFNIQNYLNTLPPNPSKKIFKEYNK